MSDEKPIEKRIKKQFIAGAVCPKCAEMDKIVVFRQGDDEYRECVSCGFLDKMVFKPIQRELSTRVNVEEAEKPSEVQVLEFPPPRKP